VVINVVKLVFLGTGGARVMMAHQWLSTGGIRLEANELQLHLDPGPGALVKSHEASLDPGALSAILVTHRHLDHCGDLNAMAEAMTLGGFHKGGQVFLPQDALDPADSVLFRYVRSYLEDINVLKPNTQYALGEISFVTSPSHHHGVETYGQLFQLPGLTLGYLPDTAYFPELAEFYRADVLIVSMLGKSPHPRVLHLSVPDVEKLVLAARPKLTILTHFGVELYRLGPHRVAAEMGERTGLNIVAASDGANFVWG